MQVIKQLTCPCPTALSKVSPVVEFDAKRGCLFRIEESPCACFHTASDTTTRSRQQLRLPTLQSCTLHNPLSEYRGHASSETDPACWHRYLTLLYSPNRANDALMRARRPRPEARHAHWQISICTNLTTHHRLKMKLPSDKGKLNRTFTAYSLLLMP